MPVDSEIGERLLTEVEYELQIQKQKFFLENNCHEENRATID